MITNTGDAHMYYLQALDGFLSNILTKRFHMMDEIAETTLQYKNKCMELERYIGISITPKSHIIEDHSITQQRHLKGIGDLEESFGERNHQLETRNDVRYASVQDFDLKERLKSRDEAQSNHPDVKDKMKELKVKKKRDRGQGYVVPSNGTKFHLATVK